MVDAEEATTIGGRSASFFSRIENLDIRRVQMKHHRGRILTWLWSLYDAEVKEGKWRKYWVVTTITENKYKRTRGEGEPALGGEVVC